MAKHGLPPGRLAALAAMARQNEATHQPGAVPHEAPESAPLSAGGEGESDIGSILGALKSGQMGAGGLLQLLAMMLGQGGGQTPQGAPPQMPEQQGAPSPIEAAYGQ